MRLVLSILTLLAFIAPASAACEFNTNCSRDSYGNTYTHSQNLGGGYNTYRNGNLESQTRQNLNGGWDQNFQNGPIVRHNSNPFEPQSSPNSFNSYRR
jgi:hypothetical protein